MRRVQFHLRGSAGASRTNIEEHPATEIGEILTADARRLTQINLYKFVKKFELTRWPSGNPSTGFKDTDPSPTMAAVVEGGEHSEAWELSFAKRGAEELYDVTKDPRCITNLAGNPEYTTQMAALKKELFEQLTQPGDLRMTGEGDWYDSAENPYGKEDERDFYQRLNAGEKLRNRSEDYERPDLEDCM